MKVFGLTGLRRHWQSAMIVVLICAMGLLIAAGRGRTLACAVQGNAFWRNYVMARDQVVIPTGGSICPWQDVARAYHAHATGAYQEEWALWEWLLTNGPQQGLYKGRLADLALQRGDYSTAYRLFAELMRFDELLEQVLQAMDARDWTRARTALEAASQTDSERARADRDKILLLFGMLHAYQHEVEQAESYYQQAIQLTPEYATAYMKWGQVLTEDRQYERAAGVLLEGLNRGLVTHGILAALGHNALLSGDLAAAEGYLQQAIAVDPQDPYIDATRADLQRVQNALKTKGIEK